MGLKSYAVRFFFFCFCCLCFPLSFSLLPFLFLQHIQELFHSCIFSPKVTLFEQGKMCDNHLPAFLNELDHVGESAKDAGMVIEEVIIVLLVLLLLLPFVVVWESYYIYCFVNLFV